MSHVSHVNESCPTCAAQSPMGIHMFDSMCDSRHISSGHIDVRHIDVRHIDANVSRVTHVTAKLPNNSTLRCTCLYVKGTTNLGSVTYFRDIFIYGFRDSFINVP